MAKKKKTPATVEYEDGVAKLTDDAWRKIAEQVVKICARKDAFAAKTALEKLRSSYVEEVEVKLVDGSFTTLGEARFIWVLLERGKLNPWKSPLAFELVEQNAMGMRPGDLARLVADAPKGKAFAAFFDNSIWRGTWLATLVGYAHARDSKLVEGTFPAHVRPYIEMMCGKQTAMAKPDLAHFVSSVRSTFLQITWPDPKTPKGRTVRMLEKPYPDDHPGTRGEVYGWFACVAPKADLYEAVLADVLSKTQNEQPFHIDALVAEAAPHATNAQRDAIALAATQTFALEFLERRDDSPEDLCALGESIKTSKKKVTDKDGAAEACVILAAIREKARGKTLNERFDALFERIGPELNGHYRTRRVAALESIGVARAEPIVAASMELVAGAGLLFYSLAAPSLRAAEKKRVEELPNAEADTNLHHELSRFGANGGLDDVVRWHDDATTPKTKRLWRRVAMESLARIGVEGRAFDEGYDRLITFGDFAPNEWIADTNWRNDLVSALPQARRDALLRREITVDSLPALFAYSFLDRASDDVIAHAFDVLAKGVDRLQPKVDVYARCARQLGWDRGADAVEPLIRKLLEATNHDKRIKTLFAVSAQG